MKRPDGENGAPWADRTWVWQGATHCSPRAQTARHLSSPPCAMTSAPPMLKAVAALACKRVELPAAVGLTLCDSSAAVDDRVQGQHWICTSTRRPPCVTIFSYTRCKRRCCCCSALLSARPLQPPDSVRCCWASRGGHRCETRRRRRLPCATELYAELLDDRVPQDGDPNLKSSAVAMPYVVLARDVFDVGGVVSC